MRGGGNHDGAAPAMREAKRAPFLGHLGNEQALGNTAAQADIGLDNIEATPLNQLPGSAARVERFAPGQGNVKFLPQILVAGVAGTILWCRLLKPGKA